MKLGIDTRFYSKKPTGIGRYIYDLCSNIIKYQDIDLYLFLNNESPLLKDKKFNNTNKIVVKEKLFNPLGLFTLGAKIDSYNLDLFHSTSYIIPLNLETPSIITIYDLIHLNFDYYGFIHRLYYEIFVKKAILNAEEIITISKHSKRDIKNWIKNVKVNHIYLGVESNFQPSLGITDLFYQYQIEPNNFILYVGNNRKNKNLRKLLEAYFLAKNEFEALPELILTCDPDIELKTFIEDHSLTDSVKFIGSVTEVDLILLYSYALFFVFPSIYEGFGLPILEAMSCGCPVTTSNLTSIPEVGGDAVLYFNPYDANSIKKALLNLASDFELRKSLSEKGLIKAKSFSIGKMIAETYDIYKRVIM